MNYDALSRLNFLHLRSFWAVVREGGLVPAARALRVSHPTISTQVHQLEHQLGERLFTRVGRRLVLTEHGHVAFQFADEVFSLGSELLASVGKQTARGAARLNVGIVDVVPKYLVRKLLRPALELPTPVRLTCFESSLDDLLSRLAMHSLDLVIADAPVPPGHAVRAWNHPLGESSVSLFATRDLARKVRRGFPGSLEGTPMLLPLEGLPLRRALNHFFTHTGVHPRIVAEFEDSALLKVFGAEGLGLFPAPTAITRDVVKQYDVEVVGRLPVTERYYAINTERRVTHPAVAAICARPTLLAR